MTKHTTDNKKFELILTRRAKAYSSSCSQTVSPSPDLSSQFILGVCAAAEDRKINKTNYFGSSVSFKVIDVDTTEKLVTYMLVVIGSMPMPILFATVFTKDWPTANSGKIMTFTEVPFFDVLVRRFP